jgi:hypothetical protein
MGMGFGGDIYPRACLHAGPVGISSRPIFTERSGREHLDSPYLPVSSNDSLDGGAERDDFVGANRNGGTTRSRGISKTSGVAARFSSLAVEGDGLKMAASQSQQSCR